MSDVQTAVGSVVALWRYPVKSMMGEEINAATVTERGLLGDRAYALVDRQTGKVVSAKNPKKWPGLFDFRARFAQPPRPEAPLPAVQITLPDGTVLTSDAEGLEAALSQALGRQVAFQSAVPENPTLEEYWPDIEQLDHRDELTDEAMPAGSFFDGAAVHLLTTATLDELRAAYPNGRFEVRRFRPNIVVRPEAEATGFVENAWVGRTLAVGPEVRLRVVKPCPRCVMTTLAQSDLPADTEILRTAALQNQANVGVYASVIQGGAVRRGDAVRLEP
ncbi:MAG TPA: MOSC domain-containing protein [Planctomycetaceae bacterium]|nr:MOSC domain-containing protein [Planctomycetaceae bacterium]HIQ23050.1 MOSC domain-containing protein [Planctomycetota bacterium]